ncbi:type II/IV secretion system ATPase subunit [Candidatus Nanobsidianus stetteri]|uniref:Secretion system protein E n=1 Tax=Nanobsidianus stetteri TaxID=1294122 RepID=A0A2T9WLL6_NANST|nr:type II/IV secretion system ATPase subunit [Candidatus Nanobsidianus stetteri]MCC5447090.1 type II/IV secretion system ATPase subunit [Candidatus Nanobsidianus stetteri]
MINIKFINDIKINVPKNKFETNITYPIVEPFSYAHIYFDRSTYDLVYEIIEPKLTENEEKIYKNIIFYIEKLLYIKLSEIGNLNDAINYLQRLYDFVLNDLGIQLGQSSYEKIFYYIFRDLYGYNKVDSLLRDPLIEDIECSGPGYPIFIVHRYFGNLKTNIILNDKEIRDLIEKFALRAGKHISYAEPILDATLPDGSRINATYSQEITTHGPTFTIRKFREIPWTPIELIRLGSATPEIFAYLWLAVEFRKNIIIIGGTASGKTTMLNAISMFIPPSARIVSIEDTREIKLYHPNWIPSVVKYSSDKNREIDMFELLRMSFRQRPDYVIVGEVRGEEAYVMFQGMASGHSSLSTMHAESTKALISRLTTPPINLSPSLIELLNVVVIMQHDNFLGTNLRRIKEINEIIKYNRFNIAYKWNPFKREYLENPKKYLFRLIENDYGIRYKELYEEYIRRVKLLERLSELNISDFQTFSKIIQMYYYNKENILRYYNIE